MNTRNHIELQQLNKTKLLEKRAMLMLNYLRTVQRSVAWQYRGCPKGVLSDSEDELEELDDLKNPMMDGSDDELEDLCGEIENEGDLTSFHTIIVIQSQGYEDHWLLLTCCRVLPYHWRLWSSTLLQCVVVEESNRYAKQVIGDDRYKGFSEITVAELSGFLYPHGDRCSARLGGLL